MRNFVYCYFFSLVLLACTNDKLDAVYSNSEGVYCVDLSISDTTFTNSEKKSFENAKLSLNKDRTFTVSHFKTANGTNSGDWEIIGGGIERRIRLNYSWGYDEIDVCNSGNCVLILQAPKYVRNKIVGYRDLAFRKCK